MRLPAAAHASPERIARRSGSNFLASFGSLERARRRGLTAIYAFCRVADDAVDLCPDPAQGRVELEFWRSELALASRGVPTSGLGRALARVVRDYGVEPRHLEALLDGVAADLGPRDIPTFAELDRYCFQVACSVGLACLPVFGATGAVAERYAIDLGHALQLTNILRDLAADARAGRIYVPRELRDELGIDDHWLEGRGPDPAYAPGGAIDRLVAQLVARAQARFAATERIDAAQRARLVPAEIMAAIYGDLLRRIAQRGGGICRSERVRVPLLRKIWLARGARRRARATAS